MPNEKTLNKAAQKALKSLLSTDKENGGLGLPSDLVYLAGYSLGTGVAANLSCRHKFPVMTLIAPFTSLPRAAGENFRYLYGLENSFEIGFNTEHLFKRGRIQAQRTLLLHGDNDTKVRPYHSEILQRVAPKNMIVQRVVLPGQDHGENLNFSDIASHMFDFAHAHGQVPPAQLAWVRRLRADPPELSLDGPHDSRFVRLIAEPAPANGRTSPAY